MRADPVFPTDEGFERIRRVFELASQTSLDSNPGSDLLTWIGKDGTFRQTMRIISSVVDEPTCAKRRYEEIGREPFYGEGVHQADDSQLAAAIEVLSDAVGTFGRAPSYEIQTCCEPRLHNLVPKVLPEDGKVRIVRGGCVSAQDVMEPSIANPMAGRYGESRRFCLCSFLKRELLAERRRCGHGCLYCCWPD